MTLSTYAQYAAVTRDISRSLDRVSERPDVQREADYYLENIGSVKTIEDFVSDRRLFSFAMKAFGLGDLDYAKGLMTKVLEGGRDDRDSLANKLSDPRYRQFAEVFDFKRYGDATTAFSRTQKDVVDMYVRQNLEESEGAQNEGVRLALYFERKADGIESVMDILGDKALGSVVRTALGLPDTIALLDIDRQSALIEEKLDVADLRDPVKRAEFLKKFTSLWELKNPASGGASDTAGLIFGSAAFGLSEDLMLAIQNVKR